MTNAFGGAWTNFGNLPALHFIHTHVVYRFATAIVIKIAFGHQITSDDDIYLQMTDQLTRAVNNGGPPGSTPVDFFPFREFSSAPRPHILTILESATFSCMVSRYVLRSMGSRLPGGYSETL